MSTSSIRLRALNPPKRELCKLISIVNNSSGRLLSSSPRRPLRFPRPRSVGNETVSCAQQADPFLAFENFTGSVSFVALSGLSMHSRQPSSRFGSSYRCCMLRIGGSYSNVGSRLLFGAPCVSISGGICSLITKLARIHNAGSL